MTYVYVQDGSPSGGTWMEESDPRVGMTAPTAGSGSFLSGIGGVIGGIGGFITGGVPGAISGFKAGEALAGGGSGSVPNLPQLPGTGGGINMPFPVAGPGGVLLPGYGGATGQAPVRVKGHMTKGTKKNPSHWTNRRRPRMNPMNVHAARRAVSRIRAAEKLFRRILAVSHPGHAHGTVKPKRLKSGH